MKIKEFDTDKKVLIVAEIGNNHEGSYALAEEMIGLAAEAGADAVKFQTYKTEFYVSNSDVNRFNRLKRFELSFSEFEKLAKVAKENGLIFISTPFDLYSADFLAQIIDAYKISSGDNTFYPLIEKVAEKGKPVLISSGLVDYEQIKKSICLIEEIWERRSIKKELALLRLLH